MANHGYSITPNQPATLKIYSVKLARLHGSGDSTLMDCEPSQHGGVTISSFYYQCLAMHGYELPLGLSVTTLQSSLLLGIQEVWNVSCNSAPKGMSMQFS